MPLPVNDHNRVFPRTKCPSTETTPADSKDLPERSALAAPSSIVSLPAGSRLPEIHAFQALTGLLPAQKKLACSLLSSFLSDELNRLPDAITMGSTRFCGDFSGIKLGFHPPAGKSGGRFPRYCLDLRRDRLNNRDEFSRWILMRQRSIKTINVRYKEPEDQLPIMVATRADDGRRRGQARSARQVEAQTWLFSSLRTRTWKESSIRPSAMAPAETTKTCAPAHFSAAISAAMLASQPTRRPVSRLTSKAANRSSPQCGDSEQAVANRLACSPPPSICRVTLLINHRHDTAQSFLKPVTADSRKGKNMRPACLFQGCDSVTPLFITDNITL